MLLGGIISGEGKFVYENLRVFNPSIVNAF